VIAEAVTMLCASVIGNDSTIATAAQYSNFQLNTMLPLIAFKILESIDFVDEAAAALATWRDEGVLNADTAPTFSIYRMDFTGDDGIPQRTTGVLGALALDDDGSGVMPHERTLPKAKTDRGEPAGGDHDHVAPRRVHFIGKGKLRGVSLCAVGQFAKLLTIANGPVSTGLRGKQTISVRPPGPASIFLGL